MCILFFNLDHIYQAHPWFKGTKWDDLYQMEAAFLPEVNNELDTQNFEKFEEVRNYCVFISKVKWSFNKRNICFV